VEPVLPDGRLAETPVLAQEVEIANEEGVLWRLDAGRVGQPSHDAGAPQACQEQLERTPSSMHRAGGIHRDAAPGPRARDLAQEHLDVGLAEVTQLDAVRDKEPAERLAGVDVAAHGGGRIAARCQLRDNAVKVRPDDGGVAVLLNDSSAPEELLDHLRLLHAGVLPAGVRYTPSLFLWCVRQADPDRHVDVDSP
jgi:hypothetical protein